MKHVYIYHHPDLTPDLKQLALTFTVGILNPDGFSTGCAGAFARFADALLFAEAVAASLGGVEVAVLPSAEPFAS
jgi:hypothetical protein